MAKIYVSAVIEAPIDRVWDLARDFNGHHGWHPAIADSHIEDGLPSDRVGCVRNFRLTDGGQLREQLLTFSDIEHFYTYNILEGPLPISDYVATFRLRPITEGNRTFGEWQAEFDVAPADSARIVKQISTDIFAAGFTALERAVRIGMMHMR